MNNWSKVIKIKTINDIISKEIVKRSEYLDDVGSALDIVDGATKDSMLMGANIFSYNALEHIAELLDLATMQSAMISSMLLQTTRQALSKGLELKDVMDDDDITMLGKTIFGDEDILEMGHEYIKEMLTGELENTSVLFKSRTKAEIPKTLGNLAREITRVSVALRTAGLYANESSEDFEEMLKNTREIFISKNMDDNSGTISRIVPLKKQSKTKKEEVN